MVGNALFYKYLTGKFAMQSFTIDRIIYGGMERF